MRNLRFEHPSPFLPYGLFSCFEHVTVPRRIDVQILQESRTQEHFLPVENSLSHA
jgi:hypothetical protein